MYENFDRRIYDKLLKVINSCKNEVHCQVTENCINNFHDLNSIENDCLSIILKDKLNQKRKDLGV